MLLPRHYLTFIASHYLPALTSSQVRLHGRDVRVRISTCLDYAATRSMYGMRVNSSPHSLKLHPHLVIEAPKGAKWAIVQSLIHKEMPWRELPAANKPLNHVATSFPFKCLRCPYRCRSQVHTYTSTLTYTYSYSYSYSYSYLDSYLHSYIQVEQDANVESLRALQADKSVAGKKVVAARVKSHCEAHDDVMEHQVPNLTPA